MNPSSLAGHVVELVDKIAKSELPADRIVADFFKGRRYIGSHDRKWINEKTYGIVRNFLLLKDIVEHCEVKAGALTMFLANEFRLQKTPEEVNLEYSQMLESYKISGAAADAHTLFKCAEQRLGEVRNDPRLFPLLYSFPDFFSSLLPRNHQCESAALMEALNHEASVCLRVNSEKIGRDEAVERLKREGIEAASTRYSPMGIQLSKRVALGSMGLYKNGFVEVQDEASQLVGLVMNPQAGETIVDACAGAGGKSLEIASLSKTKSKIFSLDINQEPIDNLIFRARKSHCDNINAIKVRPDGLQGIEGLISSADKVLVDAPCSGSGTIRRNPDKKFRLTAKFIEEYSARQKILLDHYSKLVRPGGLLFYATCSLFEIENNSVVEWFLGSNSKYEKVDLSASELGKQFPELIEDGNLAIYPHKHNMDGFFVAAMKREMNPDH